MIQSILPQNGKRQIMVNSRTIGWLEGSTFYKSVIGSKHRLRRPPAWAIDAEAFDRQIKTNATEFIVINKETGIEYQTSVETFDRFKKNLDRGFGEQYYLVLEYWQTRAKQLEFLGGGSYE